LKDYFEAIVVGQAVAIGNGYSFIVEEKAMSKDGKTICLKTMSSIQNPKPYGMTKITKEGEFFIHEGKAYFQKNGQEKYFTLAKGEEWTGGTVFDDYC